MDDEKREEDKRHDAAKLGPPLSTDVHIYHHVPKQKKEELASNPSLSFGHACTYASFPTLDITCHSLAIAIPSSAVFSFFLASIYLPCNINLLLPHQQPLTISIHISQSSAHDGTLLPNQNTLLRRLPCRGTHGFWNEVHSIFHLATKSLTGTLPGKRIRHGDGRRQWGYGYWGVQGEDA